MPELAKVLTEEDLSRRRPPAGVDMGAYVEMLHRVREQGGVGALVILTEGESQRAEKRRLSVAAKQEGYDLTWRKAPAGQLKFVLSRPGEPKPGGRPRRAARPAPAPEPARQDRGRRRAG